MNAPFHPRHGATRDPFAANVCDESTLYLVREIATEFGWPHERIQKGGLRAAAQGLAVAASPTILLVDLSDTPDPLAEIDSLAEVCEPGTIVIACGPVNDIHLYRELVHSGMHDYLPKPLTPQTLRDALAEAQATLQGGRGDAADDRSHIQAAVIGVRGGVGATTVAASLAWSLGEEHKRATAFLDLDIYFGTGALALDLEPGRGLTDAIENPSRIDGLFLERAMVRASEHLSVLSAEAPINQPLPDDGSALFQLEQELRGTFDCTVVDLPRHMMVQHPALMESTGVAIIVTEFTLAATRDTIRILAWLKTHAPRLAPLILVNRAPAVGQSEIGRKEFEASIERPVNIVVPFDPKLSVQAAKLGKPLIDVAKGSKLGLALGQVAPLLLATCGEQNDGPVAAKSLLGRLGDLRAMLPKKAK